MRRRTWWLAGVLCALVVAGCSDIDLAGPPPTQPEAVTTTPPPSTTTTSSSPPTTLAAPPGSVLVMGDWGADTDAETELAAEMEAYATTHPVEAVLTTGDNFYIDDGDLARAPFAWVETKGLDWWVAWGNHDIESQTRIDEVNRLFSSPPRWTTVEWGAVDIIILDSDVIDSEDQIAFLASEMKRIDKPTIVAFHHPPLNCSVHGDMGEFWDEWAPLFDDDVVLVLNGHAHNYQRFDDHGVQYVVTGGGGRGIYELDDCPAGHVPRVAGDDVHHFLSLTQTSDRLDLTAIDTDGEVIDDISIPLKAGRIG